MPQVQQQQQVFHSLLQESEAYHDILLGDFKDTYHHISYKALTAIWWVVHYCPTPPLILKTDDDIFVNIFALAKVLNQTRMEMRLREFTHRLRLTQEKEQYKVTEERDSSQHPNTTFYADTTTDSAQTFTVKGDEAMNATHQQAMEPHTTTKQMTTISGKSKEKKSKEKDNGLHFLLTNQSAIHCRVWSKSKPTRRRSSKWFVSHSDFLGRMFPPYCSGSAYFITGGAASALLKASTRSKFLWVDDVYITGVLAKEGGVRLVKADHLYELYGRRYKNSVVHGVRVFLHVERDRIYDVMKSIWKEAVSVKQT